MSSVDVRRAGDRFVTTVQGRTTHHSFSFEQHYDPENVGFGVLLCHNDDRLAPGHGYGPHPHRGVEIVTWVLNGGLRHEDSMGHRGVVVPGWVQRTSAGSGIVHSEVASAEDAAGAEEAGAASDAGGLSVRFVQAWVRPDHPGGSPSYALAEAGPVAGWVVLSSGLRKYDDVAATSLGSASSALLVARLGGGDAVTLPDAERLHVFVARGEAELEGAGVLVSGDAARLTGGGGHRLTANGSAEVLVWEMHPPRVGAN